MARLNDPPVFDRLDQYDFDDDPGQYVPSQVFMPNAMSDCFPNLFGIRDVSDDMSRLTMEPSAHNVVVYDYSLPLRKHSILHQPQLSATTSPFVWMPNCCNQDAFIISEDAPLRDSDHDLTMCDVANKDPILTASWLRPTQRLVWTQETDGHLRIGRHCLESPKPNLLEHFDGITQTLSVAVGQGPEYVVKLLEGTSNLDDTSLLAHTQPSPFVNHYAQLIAEYTTIYDHHYNHFYQQPSTSETELTEMSVTTISGDRQLSDTTTTQPEIDAILTTMAVTPSGWPSAGQPRCAAPHDLMDNTFVQGSPLSDLYEAPDETDDWAMLMQQDMLATGDFNNMDYNFPAETNYPQTISSPEDIFNDPLVQFDVEQSLQGDLFALNGPLPDLSTSDYLSGTDQVSVSSYLGSANTSPFEPSLDFFPDASLQAYGSAYGSVSGSPFVNTTSPSSSDAEYPYRCTTDNCTKTFRKEAQLKQHQRVHRKALVCPICRAERHTEHKFAQVRDLERHLQARHPEVAQKANVRSEIRECPHPGCDYQSRRDNVSRHHESKHGKKLKWRKNVPHVVD
ncbi:uncharacterized protein CTRU02_210099 [Colletotrichum truncatum]|uniref:Uncharacterized protein n=1 Tax=Colletotrichum truncatum TaxID=5467 RepID=A0ACC3YU77_COLTU|nr:uncharacterized protein CTRU02_02675 [Colletotrichum truncatum]KAF6798701.1 hypothetical protein CTRU02_02675 [Colletotrichum truncatum]